MPHIYPVLANVGLFYPQLCFRVNTKQLPPFAEAANVGHPACSDGITALSETQPEKLFTAEFGPTSEVIIRKLFDFQSNPSPYAADAVVVCCFDARIRSAAVEFLRRSSIVHPDLVIIAGGSLALSSPRRDFDRAFVLEQVRLAIRLHQAGRVILMSHSDCATYGGLAAFNRDHQLEAAHHRTELCRASAVIRKEFPGLLIERVFLTFDSVLSIGEEECSQH